MKRLTAGRALSGGETVKMEGMEVVFDEKATLFPVDARKEPEARDDGPRGNGSGRGH